MTTVPLSISTGTAATIIRGIGVLQDAVDNVGHALGIATQTDLATHLTEESRTPPDPRCPVVPAILRY